MDTTTSTQFNATVWVHKLVWARDELKRLKDEYSATKSPVEEFLKEIKGKLLAHMDECGYQSIKTQAGTVYRSVETRASLDDPEAFCEFIRANPDQLHLFERRASSLAIQAYREEHGQLPPGAKLSTETTVTATRVPGMEYKL